MNIHRYPSPAARPAAFVLFGRAITGLALLGLAVGAAPIFASSSPDAAPGVGARIGLIGGTEPDPCGIEAVSISAASLVFEQLGQAAELTLELRILEASSSGCVFDPAAVDLLEVATSSGIPGEAAPLFDIADFRPSLLEDDGIDLRYALETTITAVDGPGVARLDAVYIRNGEADGLGLSAEATSNGQASDSVCSVVLELDRHNILLENDGSQTTLDLEARIYGLRKVCQYSGEEIVVTLADTDSGQLPAIRIVVIPQQILAGGDHSSQHFAIEVTPTGLVGSGTIEARFQPESPELPKFPGFDQALVAIAELQPNAMALDESNLYGLPEIEPGSNPLEQPFTMTLELSEEQYDLLRSGQKDIVTLNADANGGMVARILEVQPLSQRPLRVRATALGLPVASAFAHYRVEARGRRSDARMLDQPAAGQGESANVLRSLDTAKVELDCDMGLSPGQVVVELIQVSGQALRVLPYFDYEAVDGELKEMEYRVEVDADFQIKGPSVRLELAPSMTVSCSVELVEVPLPPPYPAGPVIVFAEMVPSIGAELQVAVDVATWNFETFDLDFDIDHTYGMRWDDKNGLQPIKKTPETSVVPKWKGPTPPTSIGTDVLVKVTPNIDIAFGASLTFLFLEIVDVELVHLMAGLETTSRRPLKSLWPLPPHEDYQNPSWKTDAVVRATLDPSIEFLDMVEVMGGSSWSTKNLVFDLYKRTWNLGTSPSFTLTPTLGPPYLLGESTPVDLDMAGFLMAWNMNIYHGDEVQVLVRPQGESAWRLASSGPLGGPWTGEGSTLGRSFDIGNAFDAPGTWEVMGFYPATTFGALQTDILEIVVESGEGSYAPKSFEVTAQLEEEVTQTLQVTNNGFLPIELTIDIDDASHVQPQASGGTVEPGEVASVPVLFTCGTEPALYTPLITVRWGRAGQEESWEVGEISASLRCLEFELKPRELFFELEMDPENPDQSDSRTFRILNHTDQDIPLEVDLDWDIDLDTATPDGAQTVPAGGELEVTVAVTCDRPGTREGWVAVVRPNSPVDTVGTTIHCVPPGGGNGGNGGGGGGGNGGSSGDPHLLTLDGKRFDFQGRGEYVLARYDGAENLAFEVQARQKRTSQLRAVTHNLGLAVQVGTLADPHVLALYAQGEVGDPGTTAATLFVDHVETPIADGETIPIGTDGASIQRDGDGYWIAWPPILGTTPWVVIHDHGSHLNMETYLTAPMAGEMDGLLGDFDGEKSDEPYLDDGLQTVIAEGTPFYCFDDSCLAYGQHSWLVGHAQGSDSLFDYQSGETTWDFTPEEGESLPESDVSIGSFPSELVDWASEVCMTPATLAVFEECRLDALITGSADFALSNGHLTFPLSSWQEIVPSPLPVDAILGQRSVSSHGDVLALGQPGEARIYQRGADGQWTLATQGSGSDYGYGHAVAVGRDAVLVASPQEDSNDGAAYLFERVEGVWGSGQPIAAPESIPSGGLGFGRAVALNDRWLVISTERGSACPGCESLAGSVYVFDRDTTPMEWKEIDAPLDLLNGHPIDFGEAVALVGDELVISVPAYEDSSLGIEGAVLVYRWQVDASQGPDPDWYRVQILTHVDAGIVGTTGMGFGGAVALEGNLLTVGSYYGDDVALWRRSQGGTWEPETVLSDLTDGNRFGAALDLSEGRILVGVPDRSPVDGNDFELFEYRVGSDTWERATVAVDLQGKANYAYSVTLTGGHIAVTDLDSTYLFARD